MTSIIKSLFTLAIIITQVGYSQTNPQVKKDIEKLCSSNMKGRGYTFDGALKADKYISKQIKKAGLTVSHHGFSFSANTFSEDMELSYKDEDIEAGKEFIVAPNSPSIVGTFKLRSISVTGTIEDIVTEIKAGKRTQILLFDDAEIKKQKKDKQKQIQQLQRELQENGKLTCKAIVVQNVKKLTYSASQSQAKLAMVQTTKSNLENDEKITFNIKAEFQKKHISQNVFTKVHGEVPDSFYVFTAHYDHLGSMGKEVYFPGANDNASGTAFLLDLMRYYSENQPKYSIYFVFFSGEEIGLLGSQAFVKDEVLPLERVKFLFNFDLLGTGEDGIQVVNSTIHKKEFAKLDSINTSNQYLKQLKTRGAACNSDHCPFHREGVKSYFIYTLGGIQAYHDVYDVPETLPLTEFDDVQNLIKDFIRTNE